MAHMEWTHYDEDDNEVVYDLPMHWEICGTCDGEGKHSLHLGAITMDEWDRDWSYEEQEDYMSGRYDRCCEDCRGTGKVQVVDWESLKRENPEAYEARMEWEREEADFRAISEAERRMGA